MDNTFNLISNLNRKMGSYIMEELEKKGVNDLVLSHGLILIQFANKDVMNFKELSEKIGKSPQTMTTLIRKLEKHEYVQIKKSESDKRNKLVYVTDKGKNFIPNMFDVSIKMFEQQYTGFNDEEIKTLRFLLNKLLMNFGG